MGVTTVPVIHSCPGGVGGGCGWGSIASDTIAIHVYIQLTDACIACRVHALVETSGDMTVCKTHCELLKTLSFCLLFCS